MTATTKADYESLIALLRQMQCEPASFCVHMVAAAAERAADALQRLAPEPAVWQPIETAPKDGKRVFVSCPVHQAVDMVAAFWNDDKQAWITTPGLYPCRPSHWMRPAQPPTKAGNV